MRNAVHRVRTILMTAVVAAIGLSSFAATKKAATPPPGLCFTAQEANSTVSMTDYGSGWTLPNVEYSTDAGKTWKPFAIGYDLVVLAKVGDKVYFRGDNPTGFSQGYNNGVYFEMTGKIAASGNVMSLIDPTCKSKVIPSTACFAWLFYYCASLTTPPTLPATTLTEGCYYEMFYDCTSLTKAPALPAMTLTDACYYGMFSGCESLKTAPALPATTLAKECYCDMFNGCKSLTTAPAVLPAMTLTDACYYEMFRGCESLKAAPKLPATTLANYCYYGMFMHCSSLTTAPAELPATTLTDDCYYEMFSRCESLKAAPKLPAKAVMSSNCYWFMFDGCEALTSVKMLAEDQMIEYSIAWLRNVPEKGIFIKNAAASIDGFSRDETGIPAGWTVIDSDAVGQYRKLTLPDLGVTNLPPAGTVYSVKAYGLPAGLALKYNKAVKKGKKVIVKAKTDWWIEGVPTAVTDANQCPAYLAVTVGKTTTWYDLDLNGVLRVSPLPVVDMGTLTVGTNLVATSWLPGLGAGGWSVSGLPKGLSYTAKTVYADKKKTKVKYAPDTTYGKLSAAGLYTITAKKKNGSFYETLKFKVLVNPAGEFTTRNFTAYETFATMKDTSWKAVSGLPAGLKFDAKKYTVSGKPTKAGTFAVTFTDKKGKKKTEMWIVTANPAGPALGFNMTGEKTMSVLQGQKGERNEITFPADGTVSASGLPKGMKLVKRTDPETGVVSYALGGVPSATGTSFVTVKATKNGRTLTQRVAVTVKANPMAGTYYGCSIDKAFRYRTASLSIAASGKATMKYTEGSKTYTLTTTAGKLERDVDEDLYVYTFVQKANTKKKIPARTVMAYLGLNELGATIGEWSACTGTTWSVDAMLCEGDLYKALSAAMVNAVRTDPETGFAAKSMYLLTSEADPAEVIYATSAYSSKTGKFTVKGKLPRGKAFSATVSATSSGRLELTPISAADADGTRYLLMLRPGGGGEVVVDGLMPSEFKIDLRRYDFGTGYTALPTTFAAAIANTVTNFMPVGVTYPKKGDPATNEKEVFFIRANGSKYFQVSFDEGQTWGAKTAYAYDKARGLITLSFTKGKTKYTLDLLYAAPGYLYGQMKRQSNPVTNKKTKKTTYTTECGAAVGGKT